MERAQAHKGEIQQGQAHIAGPPSGFEVKENDQASVSHGSQLAVEGRARGRWEGRGSGEKQTWDGV